LRISVVSDKHPSVEVSSYRRVVYLTKLVKGDHQGCQKYIRSPNLSLRDTLRERILINLEGSQFPLRSESSATKFPTVCVTRSFINVFTWVRSMSLFWAK